MSRPISERDQLRALLMLAFGGGASRVSKVLEGRVRWGELSELFGDLSPRAISLWLPVLGAFLAAGLVYARGARRTAILSAIACFAGAVTSAAGAPAFGGVVSVTCTGAFTVASMAFAAELLVPDEAHLSPSRFAGMAAFALARTAMMDLGSIGVWSVVNQGFIRDGVIVHGLAAALELAALAAVAFALPPAPAAETAPVQPVYRAPSTVHEAAPGPRSARSVWPAVRPFVMPSMFFSVGASLVGYRFGSTTTNVVGGLAALLAAAYSVRVWRRREPASVIAWYGRGLQIASAGWLLAGIGLFVGVLGYLGALTASVGNAASGLSLGLVALAGRGHRRAGIWLAAWVLLVSASSAAGQFLLGGGTVLLLVAVLAFVVAIRLRGRARAFEASF